MIRFVRMGEEAVMPERQTAGAAAFDIFAAEDAMVIPGEPLWVKTGFGVEMPLCMVGQVWPRSGKASQGLDVGAGLIDADYRGEVKVLVYNQLLDAPIMIRAGERIAQITFVMLADVGQVEYTDAFSTQTERGAGGFGSTGG